MRSVQMVEEMITRYSTRTLVDAAQLVDELLDLRTQMTSTFDAWPSLTWEDIAGD